MQVHATIVPNWKNYQKTLQNGARAVQLGVPCGTAGIMTAKHTE